MAHPKQQRNRKYCQNGEMENSDTRKIDISLQNVYVYKKKYISHVGIYLFVYACMCVCLFQHGIIISSISVVC